jgi:hypothetical protein
MGTNKAVIEPTIIYAIYAETLGFDVGKTVPRVASGTTQEAVS